MPTSMPSSIATLRPERRKRYDLEADGQRISRRGDGVVVVVREESMIEEPE